MNKFIPLVSVIIPNYNNAKYITQCIESVEYQTYKPIEIVIVDDVSTDDSRVIIKELATKYDNIVPVFLDKNGGVSNARNIGVEYSSGDYICFLDPDDFFWANDKIENEMHLINEHLKMGEKIIAYSGVVCVNEAGEYVEDRGLDGQLTGHIVAPYIARYKDDKHPRNGITDKKAFCYAGGYNTSMSLWEDSDFFIRLLMIRNIYFTGKFGTAYRYKSTGLSHSAQNANKILREIERKYFPQLSFHDKIIYVISKGLRVRYNFRKRTIPLLLHKGSLIKHKILGR